MTKEAIMVLHHPRHRGDCAEFFVDPDQTARLYFDGPCSVIGDIEHAAASTGRTFNEQFAYLVDVCLGERLPDFDDARNAEDWRTLLSACRFRWSEAEAWDSFAAMQRMTP
jgi:hypothetical protein